MYSDQNNEKDNTSCIHTDTYVGLHSIFGPSKKRTLHPLFLEIFGPLKYLISLQILLLTPFACIQGGVGCPDISAEIIDTPCLYYSCPYLLHSANHPSFFYYGKVTIVKCITIIFLLLAASANTLPTTVSFQHQSIQSVDLCNSTCLTSSDATIYRYIDI